MDRDQNYVFEIKEQLDKTSSNFERKEILQKAVHELKARGNSNIKIKELFRTVALKEQDNSLMVSNNARYLELLDEILNG